MERLAKDIINTSDTPSNSFLTITHLPAQQSAQHFYLGGRRELTQFFLVLLKWFEPRIFGSSVLCSTNWATITMHSLRIMTNMVWHWTLHTQLALYVLELDSHTNHPFKRRTQTIHSSVAHKPSIQASLARKYDYPPKHSLYQLLLSVSESASLPLEWFLCRSLWECLDFFFSFFFFCFLCLDFFCKKQQQTNGEYRWSHSWTFVCLCVFFFTL